jgi:anaerobic ribonucleoside-triphosphate reductase activating protein
MGDRDKEQKIRLAGITEESVVDGEGIRFTVFTQGCPHRCAGCHNPQTHDFDAGSDYAVDGLFEKIKKNPLLDGITFSGGEPFAQASGCRELAKKVKDAGLNVWCYTGYTLEQLKEKAVSDADVENFLSEIDVLVDGPFIESQRDLLLPFRGSKNQRIIKLSNR